jgi:hypothetical protein
MNKLENGMEYDDVAKDVGAQYFSDTENIELKTLV